MARAILQARLLDRLRPGFPAHTLQYRHLLRPRPATHRILLEILRPQLDAGLFSYRAHSAADHGRDLFVSSGYPRQHDLFPLAGRAQDSPNEANRLFHWRLCRGCRRPATRGAKHHLYGELRCPSLHRPVVHLAGPTPFA